MIRKKITNSIPSSWVLCSVSEVTVDCISGSGFPKEYQGFNFGTYPFAKVGDISRRFRAGHQKIRNADHYIDEEVRQRLNAKIFPKGTIVFAKIGEALRNNYRIFVIVKCYLTTM